MKVHYLQHVSFEGLGYIETWLNQHGHSITSTRFFEPQPQLPELASFDALIIMGGPMGVHDDAVYPWLTKEKEFIRACIADDKKLLGICLGAQLLAFCLGAAVQAAPRKEIGWYPVRPTEQCLQLPWFYDIFKEDPIVFHWHGDQFAIPGGCANLLTSEGNINQAFVRGNNLVGLQFHLEVGYDNVLAMTEHGSDELEQGSPVLRDEANPARLGERSFVQTKMQIESEARDHQQVVKLMASLLEILFG